MASRTLNASRERGKTGDQAQQSFFGRFVKRWEEHAKGMFVPSHAVRGTGLPLHRPDRRPRLPLLLQTLRTLKDLKGPQLLHVITTKGKGYAPAERRPDRIPRGAARSIRTRGW